MHYIVHIFLLYSPIMREGIYYYYYQLIERIFFMNIKYRLIDVSVHNGTIDFKKVKKAGIDGVIIRAGYGNSTVDKNFHTNIKNALDNGLHVGVYWFGYAYSTELAKKEAEYCLKVIGQYKGKLSLPVFYDWEYDSFNYAKKQGVTPTKSLVSKMTDAFCKVLEDNGYYVGVYANLDYMNRYYTNDIKTKYTIWIAQWATTCTYSGSYGIWQYGAETNHLDSKYLDGISGIVDKNYCYIDYPNIITKLGFNGYKPKTSKKYTTSDLVRLKKYLLGDGSVEATDLDVNKDGKVSTADLMELKRTLKED